MKIPTVDRAGAIAASLCEHMDEKEQAMFIAGFQECVKYLNSPVTPNAEEEEK